MSDWSQLLRQAQQMQERLQKAQEDQAKVLVVGESGAGLVKVTMNGKYQVKKVQLDKGVLQEDSALVEDLIAAACNAAVQKVAESSRTAFGGMAEGMGLPPGFKWPI